MRLSVSTILAKELVQGMEELLVQDLPRLIVEPHRRPLDLGGRQPSVSGEFGNELPPQPDHYHHALYTIFRAV